MRSSFILYFIFCYYAAVMLTTSFGEIKAFHFFSDFGRPAKSATVPELMTARFIDWWVAA